MRHTKNNESVAKKSNKKTKISNDWETVDVFFAVEARTRTEYMLYVRPADLLRSVVLCGLCCLAAALNSPVRVRHLCMFATLAERLHKLIIINTSVDVWLCSHHSVRNNRLRCSHAFSTKSRFCFNFCWAGFIQF